MLSNKLKYRHLTITALGSIIVLDVATTATSFCFYFRSHCTWRPYSVFPLTTWSTTRTIWAKFQPLLAYVWSFWLEFCLFLFLVWLAFMLFLSPEEELPMNRLPSLLIIIIFSVDWHFFFIHIGHWQVSWRFQSIFKRLLFKLLLCHVWSTISEVFLYPVVIIWYFSSE